MDCSIFYSSSNLWFHRSCYNFKIFFFCRNLLQKGRHNLLFTNYFVSLFLIIRCWRDFKILSIFVQPCSLPAWIFEIFFPEWLAQKIKNKSMAIKKSATHQIFWSFFRCSIYARISKNADYIYFPQDTELKVIHSRDQFCALDKIGTFHL